MADQQQATEQNAAKNGSPEKRSGKVLPGVVKALERGRRQEAVRLFIQGLSHGIAPRNKPLLKWLGRAIGSEDTAKLVDAFVHFPCFYCKRGRMKCDDCEGTGRLDEGIPCRTCVATGVARCEFCDGSGWVTLEYVPEGLRPIVIQSRTTLAFERMKALLDKPVPRLSSDNPEKTIKGCTQALFQADRQMGVFENMFVAIDRLPQSGTARAKLDRLARKSARLAARAEGRIRELTLRLTEAFQAEADAVGEESKEQRHAREQAEFYSSLVDAERTLSGTGLEHPFLHQAVKENVRSTAPKDKPKTTRTRSGA